MEQGNGTNVREIIIEWYFLCLYEKNFNEKNGVHRGFIPSSYSFSKIKKDIVSLK